MSFPPDNPTQPVERVYQPSVVVRAILLITLATATFAIPYSLLMPPPLTVVGADEKGTADTPDNATPDDPGAPDTGGMLPSMLTFDSDSAVPPTATLSLATPYESGWEVVEQDGGRTAYSYSRLNCTVTTEVVDVELTATGKDASIEVLASVLGDEVLSSGSQLSVAELTYNFTSTVQVIGVGSITAGGKYEWTYARGLTSIGKGVIVTASCDTKDDMYEAADNLRGQFGILLKP